MLPTLPDADAALEAALEAELDAAPVAEDADDAAEDVLLAADDDRAVLPEAAACVVEAPLAPELVAVTSISTTVVFCPSIATDLIQYSARM